MLVLRKTLILCHRYIGIPLSFLFVVWFVSAFFMIYTGGMPRITPEMRIEAAPPVDFTRVTVPPGEAASLAGYQDFPPGSASLRTLLGRPAYDFAETGYGSTIVFADNGEVLDSLTVEQAREAAGEFLGIPPDTLTHRRTLTQRDQWTLTESGDLPLYKFNATDDLGTEIYVSPDNAEVSVYTTQRSRALAWLGTIPHWFYFTSLRVDQPLWYSIVVWTSGIGCILALLGLTLGVVQFRRIKPFNLSKAVPYRGMMRWHYLLGAFFGVFILTWVFSGLLSMEPFGWTNARGLEIDQDIYAEGDLDMNAFPPLDNQPWTDTVPGRIKQVEFAWIQGAPYWLVSYNSGEESAGGKRERLHQPYRILGQARAETTVIDARDFSVKEGFARETLVEKLDAAAPQARAVEHEMLAEYDNYYYSRNGQLPLPVLRVKFDDPQASWFYVDPMQSRILSTVHQWSRLERWLFNGLHSLDFAFWYHKRPLWDLGVILLLAGGLMTSCIGLYLGIRRLKYDLRALFAKLRESPRGLLRWRWRRRSSSGHA